MTIPEEVKEKMVKSLDHFKQDLKSIRTGRANPVLLDSVSVELYGSSMRLRDTANITAPEPRQLLVTPFDPAAVGPIAKGIEKANLNLQPVIDGHIVRINVPPMDEATRKEMARQAKKKADEAKVAIREIRRKGNEGVRKSSADGKISKDDVKKTENQIQDLTDRYCEEIDALLAAKQQEILII